MKQVNVSMPQEEIEVIDKLAAYYVTIGQLDTPNRSAVVRAAVQLLLEKTLQAVEERRVKANIT